MLSRLNYFLTDFKYYLVIGAAASVVGFLILLLKRNQSILLLLAICYTLLAAFVAGELYFRYGYDQSDGLGFLKVNQKWHERHVGFNNYFRRDHQFEAKKQPGEFRIAVMGDSISFGGGIEDPNDRFSNLLETKLRGDGLNVFVYNLGISGTGSEDQIKDFDNFKHLNFDLLIWQYFLNDVNPPDGGEGTRIININQDKFKPPRLIRRLTDRSFFLDWLYWRLSAKYDDTFKQLLAADLNAYENPELLSRHQQAIKQFLAQTKKDKLPVVVIIFPFMFQSLLTPKADIIYDQMLDFFQARGVTAINLKPVFRAYPASQLIASKFDTHPNELAHTLAAQELYETILAYFSHL